jgi:ADP-ribosyl-[dinitrogen reductase] hydrolase
MGTNERYLGAMLGLAVGDALGTSIEFQPPGTFEPLRDMIGGGHFNLHPGEWTDDTSMALCLAESLVEHEGFDPVDQMNRYCRWWKEGYLSSTGSCFDIGSTVSQSLNRFLSSGDPYSGSTDPNSAGNGCLMRLAPIPMVYRSNLDDAWHQARESSRLTHGSNACLDACGFFSHLIALALNGTDKEELLSKSSIPQNLSHPNVDGDILEVAQGRYKERMPPEIRGSGYVVESMESALWAFHHSKDFKSGALLAVNLGDDADTTGAIYGQLAGAYYGSTGIPEQWISKLKMREHIEEQATSLLNLSILIEKQIAEH